MKKKRLLPIIGLVVLYFGCTKDTVPTVSNPQATITTETTINPKNPYSLSNMRKAMASLLLKDIQLMANNKQQFAQGKVSFAAGTAQLAITKTLTAKESVTLVNKEMMATHYYIKFTPRNDADYAKLKVDSNLVIYPFPLDRATNPYNGSYRDPSVPAGVPTYQYAAVPVSYVLPAVPYVKLAELYLPDERNAKNVVTLKGANNSAYSVSARALANESICGTVQDEDPNPPGQSDQPQDDCEPGIGSGGTGSDPYRNGENWRPHGRLTVNDEVLGQTIGVEGIKVRARRWFTTYTGISDADGYYKVDGWYTRPANYWLDFERYDFSVNDHGGGPQEVNGPKIEDAWNVDFTDYDRFCATIFRAAFHYYYKDIQGLRRPPLNSFWATQVKIGAFEGTHQNNTSLGRTFLFGELIKIYTNPNENQSSADLYATTIHELAHAVHWQMYVPGMGGGTIVSTYDSVEDRICESWSRGVQWALTKMVYPDYVGGGTNSTYTNIIIDMLDTSSEISYYDGTPYTNCGFGAPRDQVEGYTIVQIENSLIGQSDWTGWKNNIKNLYNNETENNLDALFDAWYYY